MPLFEVVQDFADTEQAHRHDDEVDAVGELQAVERETRSATEAVTTDGGQLQPDQSRDQRLEFVAAADRRDEQHAEQRERGVLRRPEVQRDAGHDGRQQRQPDDRDRRADKGSDGRNTESRSGPALFGQREAIEHGDHRRRLAGQSQQHRGDRAAVLGPVVDAGEHDDRRHRVDGVGDRQQDRDSGRRPESRQHADDHADQNPDKAVEQVLWLDDEGEPVEKRVEVHDPSRFRA